MLSGIKSRAADAARRAALMTMGALTLIVGIAFLTTAAWIYLVTLSTPLTAALVIGGTFSGIGLIAVAVASNGRDAEQKPRQPHSDRAADQPSNQPPLMQAFLHGMQAGVSATQNRR